MIRRESVFDGGEWNRFGDIESLETTEKATYSLITVAKIN
jgi:hypothetical protein